MQLFAFFSGQVQFVEDFRHGVIIPALFLRLFKHDCILGHGNKFGPAQQGFAETSEERGSHPYNYQGDLKKGKAGFGPYNKGDYAPDALGDEVVDFLRRHKDERFFLFFSQYYVHYPLHTRCKWLVEKYEKKAAAARLKLNDAQITYAAFVETMDHLLGRVLDALDKYKLSDGTLVVLTSDNGGDPRVAWNGLRGSKWTLYEGGVREPFIVRWPGVTKAGATSDVPVIATDLMPTFCEVAGVKPPAVPLDGISILPLLTGKTGKLDRDTLIWHFPFYHAAFVGTKPCSSIRKGDMKLIHFYEDGRSELYDLASDPMEKNDLSKTQPRLAERLKDELLGALKQQNARFPESRP
ncbi:MAG: sulfatase-like hydrolase/transferase [Opitutaceae bacterium]|nr:sulfatase-like hydrolase/transferase [Opitutaceae bacterium]